MVAQAIPVHRRRPTVVIKTSEFERNFLASYSSLKIPLDTTPVFRHRTRFVRSDVRDLLRLVTGRAVALAEEKKQKDTTPVDQSPGEAGASDGSSSLSTALDIIGSRLQSVCETKTARLDTFCRLCNKDIGLDFYLHLMSNHGIREEIEAKLAELEDRIGEMEEHSRELMARLSENGVDVSDLDLKEFDTTCIDLEKLDAGRNSN